MHAFGRAQFRPPLTSYTGPSHERLPAPQARSLIVGPKARFIGYARPGYEERALELGPGARVPDLQQIDFHRRVDSFQLLCTGG